jgi:hypothetical protein
MTKNITQIVSKCKMMMSKVTQIIFTTRNSLLKQLRKITLTR